MTWLWIVIWWAHVCLIHELWVRWKRAGQERDESRRKLAWLSSNSVPSATARQMELDQWNAAILWAAEVVYSRGVKVRGAIDPRITSDAIRKSLIGVQP